MWLGVFAGLGSGDVAGVVLQQVWVYQCGGSKCGVWSFSIVFLVTL